MEKGYQNTQGLILMIRDTDDEVDRMHISAERKQQMLEDLREKLRESEAQSASGASRISPDDAMEALRKKRYGANL